MRILWVKMGGLWPPDTGGRIRSYHIVSELSRRHEVSLTTTHGSPREREELAAALPFLESIDSQPHDTPKFGTGRFALTLARSWLTPLPVDVHKWSIPVLRERIRKRLSEQSFDLCVADFLCSFPNVPLDGNAPVVLFEHNVEHLIWKRLAGAETSSMRRVALELEWRKMRRYEARCCDQARRTIAVSDVDRRHLAEMAPGADLRVVPTGVDTSFFHPNGHRERPLELVFTGSMDWYPNEDAVTRFVKEILPRIRRDFPQATFSVVGRNPSERVRRLAGDGVRVTGTVDDVRPYIAEAAVYVVPLRTGSGTRLKIFEALAMGKAVVSTTVGAEGLPLVPGEHYVRADETQQFAGDVLGLLRDSERRRALGAAGRRLVETRYGWSQVAREFEILCSEVKHHAN